LDFLSLTAPGWSEGGHPGHMSMKTVLTSFTDISRNVNLLDLSGH